MRSLKDIMQSCSVGVFFGLPLRTADHCHKEGQTADPPPAAVLSRPHHSDPGDDYIYNIKI